MRDAACLKNGERPPGVLTTGWVMRILGLIAALAVSFCCTLPAVATPFTMTITGVAYNGGNYGPFGNFPFFSPFTALETFDPALGSYQSSSPATPGSSLVSVVGGSLLALPSPIIGSAISVNGSAIFQFDSNRYGYISDYAEPGFSEIDLQSSTTQSGITTALALIIPGIGTAFPDPASLTDSFTLSAADLSNARGSLAQYDASFTQLWINYFLIDSVTVGPQTATAVPEPLTLSIFAAGLIGSGMLRARRKQDRQSARTA
jgi:hypothetical protein